MDVFTHWSRGDITYCEILNEDYIPYYVHTVHGRRYPILIVGRKRRPINWFFYKPGTWTYLMERLGLEVTFPPNLNSMRRAEAFLQHITSGELSRWHRLHPAVASSCQFSQSFGHHPNPTNGTICWFVVDVVSIYEIRFPRCMYVHLVQHVNNDALLYNGNSHPWKLRLRQLTCGDGSSVHTSTDQFCIAHSIRVGDKLLFRHIGSFKFHFFVIRNNHQVDVGEVHGDAYEREGPTAGGPRGLMSIPARSSIHPSVPLMSLSACRTLVIDREVLANDQSVLALFIAETPNDSDHVLVDHGLRQIQFRIAGFGAARFNFANAFKHLQDLLDEDGGETFCFFNFEFGKIHVLVLDVCGLETMSDHLWDYTIDETQYVDEHMYS